MSKTNTLSLRELIDAIHKASVIATKDVYFTPKQLELISAYISHIESQRDMAEEKVGKLESINPVDINTYA